MEAPEAQRWDVLIVDDDAAIRELLTQVLEDEGYMARSASHGGHALELLRARRGKPKLILLDLMMPVMSGQDFRAEQQRDPAIADIPVVILSANRNIEARAEATNVDCYLAKPVDLDTLLEVLERYCG